MSINLLNPTLGTITQDGITCTNNGNGTYTLNGTASERTTFVLQDITTVIQKNPNKKVRFVARNDNKNTYFLQCWFNNATSAIDSGNGVNFNIPNGTSSSNVAIIIEDGATLSSIVIKPMLSTNLNINYNDFVGYTGNTGQLNTDVALLKNNLNELLVSYYKTEPTLTLKKGTYWIFINKTQYSQSSIWAISSNQQPVAVANPSNEQMSIELNNDIMTITWKNASYAVVSVLKVY